MFHNVSLFYMQLKKAKNCIQVDKFDITFVLIMKKYVPERKGD